MGDNVPTFKKFVSQDEIDEQRRKRQEEWEKVRKPDQPLEAPEEEHDPRSLFERLQEQKDKQQAEHEEAYKLKNQVKGLEDDEAEFLDFVSDKQTEIVQARERENEAVLAEYRNTVIARAEDKSPERKLQKQTAGPSQTRKSQLSLLAGAVKRKGCDPNVHDEIKKVKSVEEDSTDQTARVIGILPGLGAYSGTSSESDSSSSEDSDIDTRMFSKKQTCTASHHR